PAFNIRRVTLLGTIMKTHVRHEDSPTRRGLQGAQVGHPDSKYTVYYFLQPLDMLHSSLKRRSVMVAWDRLLDNVRRAGSDSYRPVIEVLESRTLLSFGPPHSYAAGPAPAAVAVAEFNGDGIPDLVVPNSNSGTVSILLGNGDGTFQPPRGSLVPGIAPQAVAVGDFNGDHIPDLAVTNS